MQSASAPILICSDMAGTAQVRLCLPYGFDTRHSKPWVGANVDKSSLPGLTRQSIFFEKNFLRRWMDARIKSGHDECVLRARQS